MFQFFPLLVFSSLLSIHHIQYFVSLMLKKTSLMVMCHQNSNFCELSKNVEHLSNELKTSDTISCSKDFRALGRKSFFQFFDDFQKCQFFKVHFTTLLSVNIVVKTLFYHYVNNMMGINPLKYLNPKLVQYNDKSCLRHKE